MPPSIDWTIDRFRMESKNFFDFAQQEMKKPAFTGFFLRTPDGQATPELRISC